jgi:hypothetical protein
MSRPASGQGSGTIQKKERSGGKNKKAFLCVMKVDLLYGNKGGNQKRLKREMRKRGRERRRKTSPPIPMIPFTGITQ